MYGKQGKSRPANRLFKFCLTLYKADAIVLHNRVFCYCHHPRFLTAFRVLPNYRQTIENDIIPLNVTGGDAHLFTQILDLVGQPPGSLVYHFIILFTLEAALGISLGQWMRERSSGTARLTLAAFILCFGRFLVLVASILAWQGYIPRNILLPPIERAVDTISIIGLAWAFITMDDPDILNRNFLPDLSTGVMMSVTSVGFIGTYYYWSVGTANNQLFNGQWLDTIWAGSQIALVVIGLIWMLTRVRYVYDPFLKGLMLVILGGASAYHLVDPLLGDVSSMMRRWSVACNAYVGGSCLSPCCGTVTPLG